MNTQLQSVLLKGPATVSLIADELGVPKSQVQRMLREDQSVIRVRKEEGQNLYWLEAGDVPADEFEASEAELAAQATRQEVQADKAAKNPPAETPAATGSNKGTTTCPLCQAEADQVKAGPEGSYLGACRTCAACKKTYNVFSKEEVIMAKQNSADKKRSAPLNPQYKINAKIAAAEAAGGKLVYQREGRTWLLTKRGVDAKQMTAVEFSNETPESISKYLGVELAAKPAKAPKAAAAKASTKKAGSGGSKKASSSKKTSKATGAGAASTQASEPERTDAELVG